jgi:hypothetical protein
MSFSALWIKKDVEGVRNFKLPVVLAVVVVLGGLSISCSGGDGSASDVSANSQASPGSSASANSSAATPAKSGEGSITATPNPVPAGQGGGKTRISWKTKGDVIPVEVYVVQDAQPEVKFAQGAEGATEAPWIAAGSNYEFRLYTGTGSGRKLIDKVQVTRTP